MRINHNISALNAHRLLSQNTKASAGVLERLSSGKRINKAADDAAGMAISEKMKAQVRGLKKASQNTLDGISLIQTAEGAMNEVHSMLQRMRELAVQAANGTTTTEDRKSIQDEVNQLTSEVNRIANGTEFNTRNILKGNTGPETFSTVHRMSTGQTATVVASLGNLTAATIDSSEWSSMSFSIFVNGKEKEVRFNKLAQLALDTPAPTQSTMENALLEAVNNALGDDGEAIFTDSVTAGIKQIEIRTTSIGGDSEIALKGDTAITSLFASGQDATGANIIGRTYKGKAENDLGYAKGSFNFDKLPEIGSKLTIGNETIEFFNSSVQAYAGSNRAIDLKDFAAETGGIAEGTAAAAGKDIKITAGTNDGQAAEDVEIKFVTGAVGASWTGNVLTVSLVAATNYTSSSIQTIIAGATGTAPNGIDDGVFTVGFAGSLTGTQLNTTSITLKPQDDIAGMVSAISNLEFAEVELIRGNDAAKLGSAFGIPSADIFKNIGESGQRLFIKSKVDEGFKGQLIYLEGTPKEFITNLQIGPNQGQGFRLEIGDIRAQKLLISSEKPDGNPGVKGSKFYQDHAAVTNGLSANKVEYALDVMSEETATAAITVYNNAILRVAEMRGALGAIQNRLEYTATNLDNTTENLTAALSRIEDADMALEMSEFTKLNILQQAGTAMLAQANQKPQSILQLLGQ